MFSSTTAKTTLVGARQLICINLKSPSNSGVYNIDVVEPELAASIASNVTFGVPEAGDCVLFTATIQNAGNSLAPSYRVGFAP